MSLPYNGPISFYDIQNILGGINPISINEYFSDGEYAKSINVVNQKLTTTRPKFITTPEFSGFNTLNDFISTDSDYRYIAFLNNSSSSTISYDLTFSDNTKCDVLIVAGGGSGGIPYGGGGGAGGVVYLENIDVKSAYITIGKGGESVLASTGFHTGSKGYDSSFRYFNNIYQDDILVTSDNLIAWYKFDGDFTDSSGNGNTLTIGGGSPTISTTEYKINNSASSASFISSLSYLTTPSVSLSNKAFSVCVWVKATKNSNSSYFISQGSGTTQRQHLHIGFNVSSGVVKYNLAFWSDDLLTTENYASDLNNWVHLVYLVETNYNRKIYRNGILIASDTNTDAFTSNDDLKIGTRYTTTHGYYDFEGYLDDLRIYDKALSQDEINNIYNYNMIGPLQSSYNDIIYNIQSFAEFKTKVSGWRLVRYLPSNNTAWYNVNDNALGTTSYGTEYDLSTEWSVLFGHYDEMLFSTFDMTHWLYCTKATVQANYSNQPANIIRSSISDIPYTALWYNRTGNVEDPWISIVNHYNTPHLMLYGEGYGITGHSDIRQGNAMCVFVRNSVSPNIVTIDLQKKAEEATMVNGWRIVRFLPHTTSDDWYSYDDNAMGTMPETGNIYDYTNEWTVLFGHFDEILFSTFDMTHWLRTTKAELQISGYSNTDRKVLSSSRFFHEHTIKWYNRTGVADDPFISLYDHLDYAPETHMHCLYADGNSPHHKQLLQDHTLGGMCVFVRDTTQKYNTNPIPDFKVLIFKHDQSDNNTTDYTINIPNKTKCDILIVAGGGGGGSDNGGGGGAGGLVFLEDYYLEGEVKIRVGKGGDGGSNQGEGNNGTDSFVNFYLAKGGGGGGKGDGNNKGAWGGSGGGGAGESDPGTGGRGTQGFLPTPGYGNFGGSGGIGSDKGGGGGGGAGSIGRDAGFLANHSGYGGRGGEGLCEVNNKDFKLLFNIIDTDIGQHKDYVVYFAGGGGAGNQNSIGAMDALDGSGKSNRGGWGGGGAGGLSNSSNSGFNGLPNTGGGGGGGYYNGTYQGDGGAGGSGIVIIRLSNTIYNYVAEGGGAGRSGFNSINYNDNNNPEVISKNLLIHYNLNDNFDDISGNNNHLTPSNNNTPTIINKGVKGNALRMQNNINTNNTATVTSNNTVQPVWQYFQNTYISDGEYTSRTTNLISPDDVENNPSRLAQELQTCIDNGYYGFSWNNYGSSHGVPDGYVQFNYVGSGYHNTITATYNRYGSMTNYNPTKRHMYVHIANATVAGVYQEKSYATLLNADGTVWNSTNSVSVRDGTLRIPTLDLVNKEYSISFYYKLINNLDSYSGIFILGENERVSLSGSIEVYHSWNSSVNDLKIIYRNNNNTHGGVIFNPIPNIWYNITITVISTELKVYVDSQLKLTFTLSNGLADGIYSCNYFGCFNNSQYIYTRDDYLIDEFKIYDRLLSETEIASLYNSYNIVESLLITPYVDKDFELYIFKHDQSIDEYTNYTIDFVDSTLCDILVVGGGGSGGNYGGGGGGGDVLYFSNVNFQKGNYKIKIGRGGIGNNRNHSTHGGGYNGYNTSIIGNNINIIAGGGGGGGGYSCVALDGTLVTYTNPIINREQNSSGAGGGEIQNNVARSGHGISGNGATNLNSNSAAGGGGGSGHITNGAIGNAPDKPATDLAGNGGIGYESNISGTYTKYGGGGGGGDWTSSSVGALGVYGGGNGSGEGASNHPENGEPHTGGGGGGRGTTNSDNSYGRGGSGIIIIKKKLNNTDKKYKTLTFTHNNSLTSNYTEHYINFPKSKLCDILVVGGGGAGGRYGGGGGGGDVKYFSNVNFNTGKYLLKVGAGGLHGRGGGVYAGGYSGYTSSIESVDDTTIDIKAGGGGGGAGHANNAENGLLVTYKNHITQLTENSSGGGGGTVRSGQGGGLGSGNYVSGDGGIGNSNSNNYGGGGGGGGSEGNGESAIADNVTASGNGGFGYNSDISGLNINYGAGGGGGGRASYGLAGGESGGQGTSWSGTNWNGKPGFPGKDNQGGGGGGSGDTPAGGKGGFGVIIIRYIEDDFNIENVTTYVKSSNLMVHYKLDGNYLDSSGNDIKLIPQNYGLDFELASINNYPYTYIANSTSSTNQNWALSENIDKNVPLTIMFWFKKIGTAYYTIIGYGNYPTSSIQFDLSGSSIIVYTALPNHWTISPSYANLSLNKWYHCAYVLTDENPVNTYLYINGILRATGQGSANAVLGKTASKLTVANSGDGGRGFEGQLGNIRVYDCALNVREINNLYIYDNINPIYPLYEFQLQSTIYPILDCDSYNLKAWYKFDNNYNDAIGNNNIVSSTNSTFSDDAIYTNSVYVPSGEVLMIPSQAASYLFNVTTPHTFAFWCKISVGTEFIFGALESTSTYDRYMLQLYSSNNSIYWTRQNDRVSAFSGLDVRFTQPEHLYNIWHHYVLVGEWNGTNITSKIYLDGVEQTLPWSANGTQAWPNPVNYLNGQVLKLGGYTHHPGTTNYYGGTQYFDDVRIYDKALTYNEVYTLYTKVNNKNYARLECDNYYLSSNNNLLAWYKFDNNLIDSSGNNNIMELITSSSTSLTDDFVDSVIDEGLKLQGSKYKITSTILPELFDSDIWSISFNIMVDSFSNRSTIITRYDTGSYNPRCGFSSTIDTVGVINFQRLVSDNAWKILKSNTIVSLNIWYHVVFICMPYKLQIYLNGVLDNELTFTQTYNTPVAHDLVGIGAFMQGGAPSTNETFYAYLDDFRIYDKVLSNTEINALANNKIINPEYKTITFKYIYENSNNIIFNFRLDESSYSWDEANSEAIANGARLPTKKELLEYLASGKGSKLTPIYQNSLDVGPPLYLEDMWCAVVANEYSNGKDYIQIGQQSSHYVGKSHTEVSGYPSWTGSSTHSFKRIYCEVYERTHSEYTINFQNKTKCDILIVGGGGGGGSDNGGGGGAGGLVFLEDIYLQGYVKIKVGKGGDGGINSNKGNTGEYSYVNNYTAIGGGGGGKGNGDNTGYKGGSGGGGAGETAPCTGGISIQNEKWSTPGYGNSGGTGGSGGDKGGGGGGGAGTVGRDAGYLADNSAYGGAGGEGLYKVNNKDFKHIFNIYDTDIGHHKDGVVYFAGGGGAGNKNSIGSMNMTDGSNYKSNRGGWGGGGAGGLSNSSNSGFNALPNTGGGGGGAYWNGSANGTSGNGGSGIVIIRYKNTIISDGGSGGGKGGNDILVGYTNQLSNYNYGYGNEGGNSTHEYAGAGGGGAGGKGSDVTINDSGGDGGIGLDYSNIFGSAFGQEGWFAGGGGGGGINNLGNGGQGGGGASGKSVIAPIDGISNTGGGGGANREYGKSGAGGSGIVLIRYKPYVEYYFRQIRDSANNYSFINLNKNNLFNNLVNIDFYNGKTSTGTLQSAKGLLLYPGNYRVSLYKGSQPSNSSDQSTLYKCITNADGKWMLDHTCVPLTRGIGAQGNLNGDYLEEVIVPDIPEFNFTLDTITAIILNTTGTTGWTNTYGPYNNEVELDIWNKYFKSQYNNLAFPENDSILAYNSWQSSSHHEIKIIKYGENKSTLSLSHFYVDKPPVPYESDMIARYSSEGPFVFSGSNIIQWDDLSTNNNNITDYRGTPIVRTFTKGSKGLNGTDAINVVYGDENSGFAMPFSMPENYTFCYIARYVGDKDNTTYNKRIFDARSDSTNIIGQNTLWGFHGNVAGRSHNGSMGWHTSTNYKQSDPDYWIIGAETKNTARFNGLDSTNYWNNSSTSYPREIPAGYNPTLSINYGFYTGQDRTTEISRWEIAEMIFYNRELNIDEKKAVEEYLSNKYSHISFKNVISDLNQFKSLSQTGLYDLWQFTYDGYTYYYGSDTDKLYGPLNHTFRVFKSSTNYYGYWNITNGDFRSKSATGYSNRNTGNKVQYNFTLPNSLVNYKVHIAVLGAGGGGGRSYGGGGGAGGQAYVRNLNSIDLQNVNFDVVIWPRGTGGGLWKTQQNCSGGDAIVTFNGNTLIGYGGYEGMDGSRSSVSGGGYQAISNNSDSGGGNGGSSLSSGCGGACGGAISTILQNVTINNQTFWNVMQDNPLQWVSYNSGWWWTNYPGAGGQGSRGGFSGDPYARDGNVGGTGAFVILIDLN